MSFNSGKTSGSNEGPKKPKRHWRILEWFPELKGEVEQRLRAFHTELIQFNGRINLISVRTEENADIIHFADAILAAKIIFAATNAKEIYDLGTGNGLPGVVMAILDPERQFVLIDKDARKIEFVRHAASRIGLKNVICKQARVEDLPAESIQCCVSRGFASIAKSIITLRKTCSLDAEYFHLKSDSWVREIAQIPTQVCAFWEPSRVGEYSLPVTGANFTVVKTVKLAP